MNEQPEALRLADCLETEKVGAILGDSAAAELRRLHEAHEWQYTMAGQRLRRIEKLEAINQELLAALKEIVEWIEQGDVDDSFLAKARAAITKAERTTT